MGKSDKKIGKGVSLPESTWQLIDEIAKVLERPQPWIFESAIQDFAQKHGVEVRQDTISITLEISDELGAKIEAVARAQDMEMSEWVLKSLTEISDAKASVGMEK